MRAIINNEFYVVDDSEYVVGCASTVTYKGMELLIPVLTDELHDGVSPAIIRTGRHTGMEFLPPINYAPYLKEYCIVNDNDTDTLVNFLRTSNPELTSIDERDMSKDNGEVFKPPMHPDDNLLSHIAKIAICDKTVILKNHANLFEKPSDMNNFKSSLIKHPTMSWDKFTFWMNLAGMDIEIKVIDRNGELDDRTYKV